MLDLFVDFIEIYCIMLQYYMYVCIYIVYPSLLYSPWIERKTFFFAFPLWNRSIFLTLFRLICLGRTIFRFLHPFNHIRSMSFREHIEWKSEIFHTHFFHRLVVDTSFVCFKTKTQENKFQKFILIFWMRFFVAVSSFVSFLFLV